MTLTDHRANGCFCGDDMLVIAGSECFDDISGLGGQRENQLRIVRAQVLTETHKGNGMTVSHQT
jgi:hypothetical protein